MPDSSFSESANDAFSDRISLIVRLLNDIDPKDMKYAFTAWDNILRTYGAILENELETITNEFNIRWIAASKEHIEVKVYEK